MSILRVKKTDNYSVIANECLKRNDKVCSY